jgi:mono/diheme cytochrome c family protein
MKQRWIVLAAAAAAIASAQTPAYQADSNRGKELSARLECVQCHSIDGEGGKIGPDLGKLSDRNFTPSSLAATMWNHAPAMWSAMKARGVQAGDMDEQAAADLFAYFYSVRFFEKPGDAARGKAVFAGSGCAGCHGISSQIQPGIEPVSRWQSLNHPLALSEAMWNHFQPMMNAMASKHVRWPELSAQDLSDLLVYLRNLPTSVASAPLLEITSGEAGRDLFASKGCQSCHGSDTALAGLIRGLTITEIAAEMWDHGPRMASLDAAPAVFEPGQMRDLLSYIWARQFFEDARDPSRGRRVFASKGCAGCHENASSGAPDLIKAGTHSSGPAMVAALWRHGPVMLARMNASNMKWPRLNAGDMSALIAYLNLSTEKKR